MISDSVFDALEELQYLAKQQAQRYPRKRNCYNNIFGVGKSFVGIAGLRGVGKTTLLKQRLLENNKARYIALDSFPQVDLFELIKALRDNYGVREILLDEVHYYPNWQIMLKKVYDFLDVKVYFTSSVAIDIIKSKVDLSRRVIVKEVHPFSFREYLQFKKEINLCTISMADLKNPEKLVDIANQDHNFKDYVLGGLLPAYLEEPNIAIFGNIAEKIIERDLVYALKFSGEDIQNVRKLLEYIANAKVDDVSYSSISRNIGITKYLAMKYVLALKQAYILNVVLPAGSNVTREPKILFVPPFRYYFLKDKNYETIIGALREEFFVEQIKMQNLELNYLKGKRGEKKPDYVVYVGKDKYIFEIGGKNKTRTQITQEKEKNKYILTQPSNLTGLYRPLVAIGFLENK